jgi:glycosidase
MELRQACRRQDPPPHLDRDRFVAVVHLHNGANTVRAQCWWQGALLGQSETQNWNVKADDLPRGEWAWSGVFGRPDETPQLASLRVALTNSYRGFPGTAQVLHFLNNNDTGARFITRHGIEQARDAAVLLLTVPGIPLVYDGGEVGAQFEPHAPVGRGWDGGAFPWLLRRI